MTTATPAAPSPSDARYSPSHPLDAIFTPRTVAVVGATDRAGSVGGTLMRNLLAGGFTGGIYPVNPNRPTVCGLTAYPSVMAVPQPVDLAVVATPAETVPDVIGQCADAGVGGVIVLSAGFRECGEAGASLERQALEQARRGRLRIIGPNCLGVAVPTAGLNATFAQHAPRPGKIALLSQSGAMCTAILDWSVRERVGFSAMVSVGSMLDVGWGDLIDYFGEDPVTRAIAIYMESIGDARSFLSAARAVALSKPIIVIKAGRTPEAGRAAASHTGCLAGSDAAVDAAFRRAGVLRVDTIADLFDMVEVLDRRSRPSGPALAIVTNAGGPGVLATDALVDSGGTLAQLSGETVQALDKVLPAHWSRSNPVDVLGDAGPERFAAAVAAAARDPATDGVLAILTPQAMTDPTATAEHVCAAASAAPGNKPVLACWMGGESVKAGRQLLRDANIPNFEFPDRAVLAFQHLVRYSADLTSLYETPALPNAEGRTDGRARAETVIESARGAGRTLLTEFESKQVLEAYGIPCVPTRVATTEREAVALAQGMGYPVALKLHSQTITHKTEVGGVRLDLYDSAAVGAAFQAIREGAEAHAGADAFRGVTVQPMVRDDGYEVILGSSTDSQLGPVLLFGLGGRLVEVFADRALALPPLTATLARRMMQETRIYRALSGVRGRPPVDLATLEQLLVRFSHLAIEQTAVSEIDVNPLLVSAKGAVALDARMVLHDQGTTTEQPARPAIRPYPTQYVFQMIARDGTPLTIRPIRPEDEPAVVRFHESLSDRSVHYRYGGTLKLSRRVSHGRLIRICFADYDREMPLVVEHTDAATGDREIVAIGRLNRLDDRSEAEFAVVVAAKAGGGIGGRLLELLVRVGRAEGLRRITGTILLDNFPMVRLCKKAGFQLSQQVRGDDWVASLDLT